MYWVYHLVFIIILIISIFKATYIYYILLLHLQLKCEVRSDLAT